MTQETFYSLQQVADLLHVKPRTVTKLITDRQLSALVVGRQWRISQAHLDEYMDSHTIKCKERHLPPRSTDAHDPQVVSSFG